jgi:hypothetical protein
MAMPMGNPSKVKIDIGIDQGAISPSFARECRLKRAASSMFPSSCSREARGEGTHRLYEEALLLAVAVGDGLRHGAAHCDDSVETMTGGSGWLHI